MRHLPLAGSLALLALPASAQVVPLDLFNTGVDSAGATLSDGAADAHWQILAPDQPAVVVRQASIPGTWLPTTSDSRWIWQTATGQPTFTTLTFRTTFDLTGLDPTTASITGRWATDNFGLDILINGVSTGQTHNTFTAWREFSVTGGFIDGTNTLDFIVQDVGSIAGFRAELGGTAEVPTPAGAAALATAGVLASRRRR